MLFQISFQFHYTKWNKSITKRQIFCDSIIRGTWSRQIHRDKVVVSRGCREWGMENCCLMDLKNFIFIRWKVILENVCKTMWNEPGKSYSCPWLCSNQSQAWNKCQVSLWWNNHYAIWLIHVGFGGGRITLRVRSLFFFCGFCFLFQRAG